MFRVNSTQQCQNVNGLKMKEISKLYLSGPIFNFFYWLFFNCLLCSRVNGMADETGNKNPLDPMDTDGDEDETAKETDDLLKDAESLLNSPYTRKAPQSNNTTAGNDSVAGADSDTGAANDTGTDGKKTDNGEKSRSVSVTSRLSNLDLSKIPGVPYQADTDINRARTHSGSIFGNGIGTGAGNSVGVGCSDTGTKRRPSSWQLSGCVQQRPESKRKKQPVH
jgi:hypothetical protein